jgi:hypothetical protein
MNENTTLSHQIIDAKYSFARLDELLENIELTLADPYNFTYEAIRCLINAVQLRGEEMKIEIDNRMNRVIGDLEEYNQKCKTNLSTNEYVVMSEKIRVEKDEGRQMLDKWTSMTTLLASNECQQCGNNFHITNEENESEWTRVKNESDKVVKQLEIALDRFKGDLLLKQLGKFRDEIREYFGNIEIDSKFNLE